MAIFSRLINPMKNGMNLCGGSKRFLNVRMSGKVKDVVRPAEDAASRYDRYGRIFLGSSCAAGLGAICLYGLRGGSADMSSVERSLTWSPVVRERVRTTFAYFSMGLATTAAGVAALHRSGTSVRLAQIMSRRPILSFIVPLGALMGMNAVNVSIPYRPSGVNLDKVGLMLGGNAVIAGIISPLAMLGGPLLLRAAVITGGAMGALSMAAMCAPSHQFLNYGAPLSLALGGMCLATFGSAFLPAGGAAMAGFHAFYVYGGLVLFGGLTLYDVQRIVHQAETSPRYDPIVASMAIYMDAINIFIRVAMMLAGSNRRK